MGIFRSIGKFFNKSEQVKSSDAEQRSDNSLTDSKLIELLAGSSLSESGIPVTPKSALKYSAVFACVEAIARPISSTPFNVFQTTSNGRKAAKNHYAYSLIKTQPCPAFNSVLYRERIVYDVLLRGNFYALKEMNELGEVIKITPLKSHMVEPYKVKFPNGDYATFYKDFENHKVYRDSEIIHVPGPAYDGLKGKSVIEFARESIGKGLAITKLGANFFNKGTHIGGYVEYPGKLTDPQVDRFQTSFANQYRGMHNFGKIPLLEGGAKFHPLAMPLKDAQFIESANFQIEDISRFFGVPPHMVGHLARSTYNNIEQQSIEFTTYRLMPFAVRIEAAHDAKIFRPSEKGDIYTKIELKGLLRGDIKTRTEFYRMMFNNAAMSANEIRSLEDVNTVEGGDDRYIQVNMIPVHLVEDFYKNKSYEKSTGPTAGTGTK